MTAPATKSTLPVSDEPLATLDVKQMQRLVEQAQMQRAIVVAELVADGVVVLKRGAAKLVEGYRAWSARRRAYGELMGLDDRMLADLGIARGEIQSVVYGEGLAETPRAVNDNRADAGRPIAA